MSTLRKLHAALGLSLVTALGLVAGCAQPDGITPGGDEGSLPKGDDGSLGQAEEALLPLAAIRCTMSSAISPTGREWGFTWNTNQPGICCRARASGVAPVDFPSCHQRAMNELGCVTVVDCG